MTVPCFKNSIFHAVCSIWVVFFLSVGAALLVSDHNGVYSASSQNITMAHDMQIVYRTTQTDVNGCMAIPKL